jgi:hypothetical protein
MASSTVSCGSPSPVASATISGCSVPGTDTRPAAEGGGGACALGSRLTTWQASTSTVIRGIVAVFETFAPGDFDAASSRLCRPCCLVHWHGLRASRQEVAHSRRRPARHGPRVERTGSAGQTRPRLGIVMTHVARAAAARRWLRRRRVRREPRPQWRWAWASRKRWRRRRCRSRSPPRDVRDDVRDGTRPPRMAQRNNSVSGYCARQPNQNARCAATRGRRGRHCA